MNQKAAIRAVVFDLDDTLFLERQYVRSGYEAVTRHLREVLGRSEAFEDWLWERFLGGRYDRAFDALSEHFHLGLSAEEIGRLVQLYREHPPKIRPAPGMADLLVQLQKQFRLGVLTDGLLPAQRLKLEALQIAPFFDAVVFTESLGRESWKPSPAGFEMIAARLDTPHAACAYVADNPAKDFVAPNALGWRTVQYRCEGQIHAHKPAPPAGKPQTVVHSAPEILTALT